MKVRGRKICVAPAGRGLCQPSLLPAPYRSKRSLAKEAAKEKFKLDYAANPLNFLPGSVVHNIQKMYPPKRWEIEGKRILEARRRNAR